MAVRRIQFVQPSQKQDGRRRLQELASRDVGEPGDGGLPVRSQLPAAAASLADQGMNKKNINNSKIKSCILTSAPVFAF